MKGSVVQKNKGSKHWYAIIERRDEATGKRVRKWITLKASGKRQAQIECAKIIAELENGMFVDPSKVTLAKFFEQWLDDIKSQVSQKTYERYAEIARKNIVPLLGQVRVSKLAGIQISAAYAKALQSGRCDGKGGLSRRTAPPYAQSFASGARYRDEVVDHHAQSGRRG